MQEYLNCSKLLEVVLQSNFQNLTGFSYNPPLVTITGQDRFISGSDDF